MIARALKNWKTTSAGLLMILTAISHVVFLAISHSLTEMAFNTALVAILGGAGLLVAGDAGQSDGLEAANAKIAELEAKLADVHQAVVTGNTEVLTKPNEKVP